MLDAAPLSNQAKTMPAAFTAGLSTAAGPTCSRFYPVGRHAAAAIQAHATRLASYDGLEE